MLKIRIVKTGSSAKAVQAVHNHDNKRIVVKHFGSCHSSTELDELVQYANEWVTTYSGQLSIFSDKNLHSVVDIKQCSFLGVHYTFFHELISTLQDKIGFTQLNEPLLNDLVIVRLLEPASKLRSIELLENYFGIKHQRKSFYKAAPHWLKLKEVAESKAIDFAKQHYGFNYDLLFYDVTTLYFETFEDDELRNQGFSKDNKSQQPQILVALMVTKEGFPITYEIFAGNTFEGHTIIPVVKSFLSKIM